jgi:hypothetical protein
MMSTRKIIIALVMAGSVGDAHAADGSNELEACIQTARDADANCAKLTDDPTQRLGCFQKARDAQLDCLEHALADTPDGATPSNTQAATSPPEQPASTGSTDARLQAAPSQPGAQESPANDPQGSSDASSSEPAIGSASPKAPASTTAATPETAPSPVPPTTSAVESAATAVQAEAPKPNEMKTNQAKTSDDKTNEPLAKPTESSWVVSETTSPVDYRPLLVAVIRPTSSTQDGPSSLTVRCRGGQTELSIHTDGTWHAPRKRALPVDRQINDQAVVRQTWNLSVDAKTATYADDAVEMLRSLPDAARLTVGVPDGANARHQATFVLTGWNAVRKKIEAACKWPKVTDQASSVKR